MSICNNITVANNDCNKLTNMINHDDDHDTDDHHTEFVGKLKYLPEFNAENSKVHNNNKWSFYLNQIKEANTLFAESINNYDTLAYSNQLEFNSSFSSCAAFLKLVDYDLKYFEDLFGQNFITQELINEMIKSKFAVHYQIVDHRLYRDSACMFPSRCDGVEHFLLSLLPYLPNMDLFINVRDYPQVGKYFTKKQQYPIFSFSKDVNSYYDITYPAWTFWSGGPALDIYPRGIGRWDSFRESLLKRQSQISWSNKRNIAFFRGSRTSAQRDPIILLSRSRPDLVDAKYTKNQAWKSKEDTLGEDPAQTVSFEEHCHYKYLFNAQGVAASFRFKHLFLCRSLVLNVNSNWIEFFYPPMKPWIHYVPLSENFADATELLAFLSDNQPIAEHIAKRGFEFIRDHLTMDSVRCYWKYLLESYSKRLVAYRPTFINYDLIEIKSTK